MSKNNDLDKHFTASGLIVENGRVLLLYHKKLGVWLYPGGHIERNETPEQALIREVKEETGLDVEIIGEKDGSLSNVDSDVSVLFSPYVFLCELVGDHYHNDVVFLCKIIGDNKQPLGAEGESVDIKFFSLEDLNDIKLFPNFRCLLEKVLKS